MHVKLRWVLSDKSRHGKKRYYFRRNRTKKMVRLQGAPGSPEFLESYNAALVGTPVETKSSAQKLSKDTLEWLVRGYYESAEFQQLDITTQRSRRGILGQVTKSHGSKPYARLEKKHIRALRDEKRATPVAANNRLKALSQVFKHAVRRDLIERNPCADVEKFKISGTGYHSWTIEEIEQYEERHVVGTKARLALALLLYTAQRRSDVVLFGKNHVREGWLTLTQHKNRNRNAVTISIPMIPELLEIIEASPAGDVTFLQTEYGNPFTSNGFGNWFRDRCDEAELAQCSAHGLRKAAATRLAEKGCSALEIMAITGHKTLAEVDRYVKAAQQKILAKSATEKLLKD